MSKSAFAIKVERNIGGIDVSLSVDPFKLNINSPTKRAKVAFWLKGLMDKIETDLKAETANGDKAAVNT